MSKLSIFKEFLLFLKLSKNWWLLPIALVLVIVGALIVLGQGSALGPAIYAMF